MPASWQYGVDVVCKDKASADVTVETDHKYKTHKSSTDGKSLVKACTVDELKDGQWVPAYIR